MGQARGACFAGRHGTSEVELQDEQGLQGGHSRVHVLLHPLSVEGLAEILMHSTNLERHYPLLLLLRGV